MKNALAVASALLLLVGCQTRTERVGPVEVRVPTPERTLVGLHRITHNRDLKGWLKTYRYEDGTGRVVSSVENTRNESLGYVLADGRAYRHTAHAGAVLANRSDDLGKNVAAIYGLPTERFLLTNEAP